MEACVGTQTKGLCTAQGEKKDTQVLKDRCWVCSLSAGVCQAHASLGWCPSSRLRSLWNGVEGGLRGSFLSSFSSSSSRAGPAKSGREVVMGVKVAGSHSYPALWRLGSQFPRGFFFLPCLIHCMYAFSLMLVHLKDESTP